VDKRVDVILGALNRLTARLEKLQQHQQEYANQKKMEAFQAEQEAILAEAEVDRAGRVAEQLKTLMN